MGQAFDPYYKWLGIPPDEQPANHYRLLGIQVFESDTDVIEAAADQRMAHLRGYQSGHNADLSQRLLNEVAAARVCLLNASKRVAYDEQLQLTIQQSNPATDSGVFSAVVEEWSTGASRPKAAISEHREQTRYFVRVIAAAVALVLLAAVLVAWRIVALNSATTTQIGQSTIAPPTTPPRKVQPQPKKVATKKAAPSPDSGHKATPPTPSVAASPAAGQNNKKNGAVLNVDASSDEDDATKKNPLDDPDLEDEKQTDRASIPSEAKQEAAMKIARELYEEEFRKSSTDELRQAMARKMLDQAQQQNVDEDGAAFVLLRLARDLSVYTLDSGTAFQAIDVMAERYDVRPVPMKVEVLTNMAKKANAPEQHAAIAEQATDLIDEASAAGDFAVAAQLAKLGIAESNRGNDKERAALAKSRLKEIQAQLKLAAEFEVAKDKLADKPDDADANSTVGSFYCFVLGDWKKGLPCFAKGADESLASLAKAELNDSPTDVVERIRLADEWWAVAQKSEGKQKEKIMLHAGWWYAKAQPAVTDGLLKLKVEKRLDEIERIENKSPVRPSR